MEKITSKRFLVRSLFDGERICQLRLVDLTGPYLSVTPFDRETASTIFVDARVILIDRRARLHRFRDELEVLAEPHVSSSLKSMMATAGVTPSVYVEALAY